MVGRPVIETDHRRHPHGETHIEGGEQELGVKDDGDGGHAVLPQEGEHELVEEEGNHGVGEVLSLIHI